MSFALRDILRVVHIAIFSLSLGACGTFHPEPYAMFADHPEYDADTAAIVSISPLEEDEYTVIGGWSDVRIAREGDSSRRKSEDSWWVSLAPGDYVIFIKAPGSYSGVSIQGDVVDGDVQAEQIEIRQARILEIPVSVESGRQYRLVRTRKFGELTYELREMEYLGDLWKKPR